MSEYFVALDGDNGNSGLSTADPFRTVSHGVGVLQTGDTLFIRGGVYVEHVIVENKDADRHPVIPRRARDHRRGPRRLPRDPERTLGARRGRRRVRHLADAQYPVGPTAGLSSTGCRTPG